MKNNIDSLIKEAMLQKDTVKLGVLRSIKTAFMNFETAKNAKELDETNEIQILKKLASQRKDSYEQFLKANRDDLAEKELKEMEIIETYLPNLPTEEDITKILVDELALLDEVNMSKMGILIKKIKEELPLADGKLVSDIVKNKLNGI